MGNAMPQLAAVLYTLNLNRFDYTLKRGRDDAWVITSEKLTVAGPSQFQMLTELSQVEGLGVVLNGGELIIHGKG